MQIVHTMQYTTTLQYIYLTAFFLGQPG